MRLSSISSFDERGRKALKACGWAALLVVAVDLCCRALLPSGFLLRIEDLTRRRADTAPAPDIEIVGDSVARSGLLAAGLTGDGLIARNSAIPASGPAITYHLLREEFASGHVPQAVLIAHSPHNFSQFRYAVLLGGFAHWYELPSIIRDYGEWSNSAYAVLTRVSYLLMHRDSFQDIVRIRDFSFFTERDAATDVLSDRSELINFRRELPLGYYSKSKLTDPVPEFYSEPFQVLPLNDRYFRRMLAMAKSHGVRVFWLTMPTSQGIMDARAKVNYEQDLLRYLGQFEQAGELKILRGGFVAYPDRMFRDWLHLNLEGAVKLACEMRQLRGPIVAELGAPVPPPARDSAKADLSRDADDPQVVLDQYCPPALESR